MISHSLVMAELTPHLNALPFARGEVKQRRTSMRRNVSYSVLTGLGVPHYLSLGCFRSA